MNLQLGFLAIDVAAIVCAAILGVGAAARCRRSMSALWLAAISLCDICHVLLARFEYRYWIAAPYQLDLGALQTPLNLARNLTPGLFMLFSHSLFSEGGRFPRWLLGLFTLQVVLECPLPWPGSAAPEHVAAAALQMGFAAAAAYWAFENWRDDLVERRRRLRAVTVLVVGLDVVAASLLLRIVIPQDTPANFYAHEVFIALNMVIFAALLMRLAVGDMAGYLEPAPARIAEPSAAPPRPIPASEAQSAAALKRLNALLQEERIHRQAGLTLQALADQVGLPAYRLRRLIHEQLGYRNFNSFLHHYRIEDACAQLRDPSLRRVPILTIALSSGYQSINTFNRGFGEVAKMTPSAFRAQAERAGAAAENHPENAITTPI